MQLHVARLCLDCQEVHDAPQCPVCASETFSFLTRWVPAPERRKRPRPTTSPEAEIYHRLLNPEVNASRAQRRWKQGLVGLTAVGLVGWLWRAGHDARRRERQDEDRGRHGGAKS